MSPICETVAPVTILLVRHARAGRRDRWKGDDRLRPLSKRGTAQARALPALLQDFAAGSGLRLVSSPWVRAYSLTSWVIFSWPTVNSP